MKDEIKDQLYVEGANAVHAARLFDDALTELRELFVPRAEHDALRADNARMAEALGLAASRFDQCAEMIADSPTARHVMRVRFVDKAKRFGSEALAAHRKDAGDAG